MAKDVNFLAFDLGASGGRALLGRFDGERFALDELHRFDNGPVQVMGNFHWDVLRLWREIKAGLRAYAKHTGAPLHGISVDTWGVDIALLDKRGKLLGNPYHYRDARTDGMPERVASRISPERLYQTTGIQVMQINTLYQLTSMLEHHDPQLELTDTLLMTPDLFHYWLSGELSSEYTIASTSQMLNARKRDWAKETLSELGIPVHMLRPLVQPGTIIGTLQPEVAKDVGVTETTPVIATGSHDTASAVAAIPDLDETSVYLSSGTWSLMGVEVAQPVLTEQARTLNFTNEGGVGGTIRLLKNVAGLWLLQESRRQWRREEREYSWDELLRLAVEAEPFQSLVDPDDAAFLSPGDMPEAIRAYCRRTGQPEPKGVGEVTRCCLESLALRYRWVLGALETLTGRRLETIYIVGGGSKNDLLNQFTADACERPVVAEPVEATALGNIMLQAVARGYLPDIASGRRVVAASVERRQFEPKHPEAWREAYQRFEGLLG